MKRAGIISFHNADNYGAVLQNYALQQGILKIRVQPITIDYRSKAIDKEYRPWIKTKSLKGIIGNILFFPFRIKRKIAFFKFRRKNLFLSKPIHNIFPLDYEERYDYFICGSDQIWNERIVLDDYDVYSLGFVKTKPKFSYAASAGTVEIRQDEILNNVKQLCLTTVREKGLQFFLAQKGVDSKIVCDPVFLLTKDEWGKKTYKNQKNKYIFLYYVGSNGRIAMQIADYESKKRGCGVCCPCDMGRAGFQYKYYTYTQGPDNFLTDIAYADYVVASSFHATAFAIIFEKDFIVVPPAVTSQRVVDLLTELGLMDRIVYSLEDYISKKYETIDYVLIQDKLRKWRNSAMQTLIEMRDWVSANEK